MSKKLKEMEKVKIRRLLLEDMEKARVFYKEKKLDVNALWDEKLSAKKNLEDFPKKFYKEASKEIEEGYMKYKGGEFKGKDFGSDEYKRFREKTLKSDEYKRFREKAAELIPLFNKLVSEEIFVPLYISSVKRSEKYPRKMMRIVYYGPKELSGRRLNYYDDVRKKGDVIVAHEIVNPWAIRYPEKLKEAPHVHWELKDVAKKGYKKKEEFENYLRKKKNEIILYCA